MSIYIMCMHRKNVVIYHEVDIPQIVAMEILVTKEQPQLNMALAGLDFLESTCFKIYK